MRRRSPMRRSIRFGRFGCDDSASQDESGASLRSDDDRSRVKVCLGSLMVAEVAEADAHVVMERVWHGHCHAESHDAVGDSEGVDVPVAQKQNAGDGSPDEGDGREDWIGQVSQREDDGRDDDGQRPCPGSRRSRRSRK